MDTICINLFLQYYAVMVNVHYLFFHAEFSRRWCTLNDGTFSYFESDKNSNPNGALKASELVCMTVDTPGKHGYRHTQTDPVLDNYSKRHKLTFSPSFLPVFYLTPCLTSFYLFNSQVWKYFWTLLRVRASLSLWHWWTRQPQGMGQVYSQGNHQIHTYNEAVVNVWCITKP